MQQLQPFLAAPQLVLVHAHALCQAMIVNLQMRNRRDSLHPSPSPSPSCGSTCSRPPWAPFTLTLVRLDVLSPSVGSLPPSMRFALVCVYFLLGSIAYYYFEGWSPLDSCYFLMVTTTTIGYGALVPTFALSKAFTVVYALLGISIVFAETAPIVEKISLIFASAERTVVSWLEYHRFIRPAVNTLDPSLTMQQVNQLINYPRRYAMALATPMLVLILGTALGGIIVDEDASWVDALYWAAISMTTIGAPCRVQRSIREQRPLTITIALTRSRLRRHHSADAPDQGLGDRVPTPLGRSAHTRARRRQHDLTAPCDARDGLWRGAGRPLPRRRMHAREEPRRYPHGGGVHDGGAAAA